MDPTESVPRRCPACGASLPPKSVSCPGCGITLDGAEILFVDEPPTVEPWLAPPPERSANPYEAPKALDEPAPTVLVVLGRIFLMLLGVGALLIASCVAFFFACLASQSASNNGVVAGLGGLVAAAFVLFIGVKLLNRLFARNRKTRGPE